MKTYRSMVLVSNDPESVSRGSGEILLSLEKELNNSVFKKRFR